MSTLAVACHPCLHFIMLCSRTPALALPNRSLAVLGGNMVHKGFASYAMALEPNITAVLAAANDAAEAANVTKSVWFTGHRCVRTVHAWHAWTAWRWFCRGLRLKPCCRHAGCLMACLCAE